VKVAFGLKSHSGWAALVVVGRRDSDFQVADRRRVELAEEEWAKQPYHAAEALEPAKAREVVRRGVEAARRNAVREIRAAVARERERGNDVAACAVLSADPMPDWSTGQILAVHFRMHKAEGVLFRDVLARAARACRLRLVEIPEKTLVQHAARALRASARELANRVRSLGESIGPPWGKDQKDAALAALVALGGGS
jgi:hypothetical protein